MRMEMDEASLTHGGDSIPPVEEYREWGQTVTFCLRFGMVHLAKTQEDAMKVFAVVLLATLAVGSAVPALADDASADNAPWSMEHNGSDMKLFWDDGEGSTFEIVYVRPRSGLLVKSGTVLIEGNLGEDDDKVFATAYLFKSGCSPAPYPVWGTLDNNGTISLTGRAPVRQGCRVVGYADTNNSSLVFTKE